LGSGRVVDSKSTKPQKFRINVSHGMCIQQQESMLSSVVSNSLDQHKLQKGYTWWIATEMCLDWGQTRWNEVNMFCNCKNG